jgi:hypothetical protein
MTNREVLEKLHQEAVIRDAAHMTAAEAINQSYAAGNVAARKVAAETRQTRRRIRTVISATVYGTAFVCFATGNLGLAGWLVSMALVCGL